MYHAIQLKNVTPPSAKNSSNRSLLACGTVVRVLIVFTLVGLRFPPMAEAQDGGYPNNNTAEGDFALSTIISNPDAGTGADNTAIGFEALFSDTTGVGNTATGFQALTVNTTGDFNTASGNQALFYNETGGNNTAHGNQALYRNT